MIPFRSVRARGPRAAALASLLVASLLMVGGCARRQHGPARSARTWLVGHALPAFDPDGPPDALRASLERLLSRGLLERTAEGAIVPAAADSCTWSADSLTLRFHLRAALCYPDGSPVTSADFAAALSGGLARPDHATRAWLLMAVRGVDRVRAGRPLPAIGVETPAPQVLVLRLSRRDPRLLERLATPGIATPFKHRLGVDWSGAQGIGPYRVLRQDAARGLTLVRADSASDVVASVDTLRVRFVASAARARTLLRQGAADLLWPLPPGMLAENTPVGYTLVRRAAEPERRLLLLFREDVPPTTKLPARAALSQALDRRELLTTLGERAEPGEGWLPEGGPFEFPSLEPEATRDWLARGQLGASFHVVLGYDADGAGAEIARQLQGQWARLGLYAELRPERGPDALAAPLAAVAPQAWLLEAQAPLSGPDAELAGLVMPLRGPAIGSFRSGWRTREFDRWIADPDPTQPLDAVAAQARLAEERLAWPLARLPWVWLERSGAGAVEFHPGYGPAYTRERARRALVH